jgi:hypothetical protein
MTLTAVYFGGLLIIIGIAGYLYGISTGHASLTALIPAAFGIAIGVLGFIGRLKANLRKHLMHVAVVLGLLGFLLPAGRLLSNLGAISFSAAVISQASMALVCLIFVILSIRSFILARQTSDL